MTVYEKRIRERFPALVNDPIWPLVETLVREDWRDDDEDWFAGVQQHCLALSKRLGLPFGPANCGCCDRAWPELGDVTDGGKCPQCVAKEERERAAIVQQNAERAARRAALTPAQKAEEARISRAYIDGLSSRDVS